MLHSNLRTLRLICYHVLQGIEQIQHRKIGYRGSPHLHSAKYLEEKNAK